METVKVRLNRSHSEHIRVLEIPKRKFMYLQEYDGYEYVIGSDTPIYDLSDSNKEIGLRLLENDNRIINKEE